MIYKPINYLLKNFDLMRIDSFSYNCESFKSSVSGA